MNPLNNSRQSPCKDCKYNAKELEQILPFKNIFINANTIPERLLILKSQILPAMFNYWVGNGQEPRDQEESRSWAKVVVYAMIDKFGSSLIFSGIDGLVFKQLAYGPQSGTEIQQVPPKASRCDLAYKERRSNGRDT